MSAPHPPSGVFVVGMHRSGTSAVAGALEELGFDLSDRLIPAAPDNPMGYFEQAEAVAINDALLRALGSSWDDPRQLPSGWNVSEAAMHAQAQVRNLLQAFAHGAVPWAIKDPRLSRMLPLWLDCAAELSLPVGVLLVVRHPAEVAASLYARDRLPADVAHLLWLRHVHAVADAAEASPFFAVDYRAVIDEPGKVIADALQHLGFAIRPVHCARIDPYLRHQQLADWKPASALQRLSEHVWRTACGRPDATSLRASFGPHGAAAFPDLQLNNEGIGQWLAHQSGLIAAAQLQAWNGERRGDALQERLDKTDETLHQEQLRSRERLHALERLHETLEFEAARSAERLHLAEDLQRRLEEERVRSIERLRHAENLQASLDLVQSSALERINALETEAINLAAGLTQAQALASKRLRKAKSLQARLDTSQGIALERIKALETEANNLAAALQRTEALATERLQQLAIADQRLAEAYGALQRAEELCLERLDLVERLDEALRLERERNTGGDAS